MKYCIILFCFFTKLESSEKNTLPLAKIPKEIRDTEILPYLVNQSEESAEIFYLKMQTTNFRQAHEKLPEFFEQLFLKYRTLNFATKMASLSPNKHYLAVLIEKNGFSKNAQKKDWLKVYRYSPDGSLEKQLVFEKFFDLDTCQNICCMSNGGCIVCLDNQQQYNFILTNQSGQTDLLKNPLYKLHYLNNTFKQQKTSIKKIEYHANKKLSEILKPSLFLNNEETNLGTIIWKKNPDLNMTEEETLTIPLSALYKLSFWYFPEITNQETNPEDPKVKPKTLEELFRRLGIAKEITDTDEQ
jgi:hypothetical protein